MGSSLSHNSVDKMLYENKLQFDLEGPEADAAAQAEEYCNAEGPCAEVLQTW